MDEPIVAYVESEHAMGCSLERLIRTVGGEPRGVSLARRAKGLFANTAGIAAALIAGEIKDGDGLDLLRELRRRGLRAPVAILARRLDTARADRAHELGAWYVPRRGSGPEILGFLRLAAASRNDPADDGVRSFATTKGLTPAESGGLLAGCHERHRGSIAKRLGVGEETVKTQIAQILLKTGAGRFREAIAMARTHGRGRLRGVVSTARGSAPPRTFTVARAR